MAKTPSPGTRKFSELASSNQPNKRPSRFALKNLLGKGKPRGGEIDIGRPVGKEII